MDDVSFEPFVVEAVQDPLGMLRERPASPKDDVRETPLRVVQPVIGTFSGFDLDDQPLVTLPTVLPGEILPARATVALTQGAIGSQAVIICEEGDPRRPIVLGLIQNPTHPGQRKPSLVTPVQIESDGERYVISAEREIVLRCGDASITLTHAGKVIIKGNYILSRSAGYNKIKGAAVDIN
jgi:hypothetical protein